MSTQYLEPAPVGDSICARPRIRRRRTMNDATRHLCVGAYVDPEYRAEILRKVYFDTSRRVPPSYGFKLPPVLAHARRAWLLDLGQHVAVAVAAIGALAIDPFSVAAATTVLISWYTLRRLARLGPAITRYLTGRTHPEEDERIRTQAMVLMVVLVCSWAALLLPLALTGGTARLAEIRGTALWVRIGALVTVWAVLAVFSALCRQHAVDRLRPGAREPVWWHNRRLVDLDRSQRRKVTVYSGYRPFVGSGQELRTWSFAQLLKPAKDRPRDTKNLQFSTADLVDHVKKHIRKLAFDDDLERRLPDLTVRDHVFVTGTHARDVPEHPGHDDILRIMSDTTKHTRHFLACRVPSWRGEVLTTVYVHVSLQGRTLYLEFSTWALPPTRTDFHLTEKVGGTGMRAYLRSATTTLWALPETLVSVGQSVGLLTSAIGSALSAERWSVLQERGIDVGTALSARELGTDVDIDEIRWLRKGSGIKYFQYRDVIKHSQVIERRLLGTVQEFLHEHGIDTTEYEQRTITILNNGVLHTGEGNIDITGAVGEGASYHNGQAAGGPA